MNNLYVVRIGHPLLRPGLTLETEASERYVVAVVRKALEAVREINAEAGQPGEEGHDA